MISKFLPDIFLFLAIYLEFVKQTVAPESLEGQYWSLNANGDIQIVKISDANIQAGDLSACPMPGAILSTPSIPIVIADKYRKIPIHGDAKTTPIDMRSFKEFLDTSFNIILSDQELRQRVEKDFAECSAFIAQKPKPDEIEKKVAPLINKLLTQIAGITVDGTQKPNSENSEANYTKAQLMAGQILYIITYLRPFDKPEKKTIADNLKKGVISLVELLDKRMGSCGDGVRVRMLLDSTMDALSDKDIDMSYHLGMINGMSLGRLVPKATQQKAQSNPQQSKTIPPAKKESSGELFLHLFEKATNPAVEMREHKDSSDHLDKWSHYMEKFAKYGGKAAKLGEKAAKHGEKIQEYAEQIPEYFEQAQSAVGEMAGTAGDFLSNDFVEGLGGAAEGVGKLIMGILEGAARFARYARGAKSISVCRWALMNFSVALSVPTRGLRPLERSFHAFPWLCQCQLAAFGRSKGVFMLFRGFVSANSRPSAARKEFSCFSVALSVPTRGLRPLERSFPAFQWLCLTVLCL
ncbi:hypothetical protein Ddc_12427 [Ditylenchus destructor]|nr:hypothetical protein Ddc_12427 [Ditylenchus destructor]